MPEETKIGCARPTGGLVGDLDEPKQESLPQTSKQEVRKMIQVGKKAPDFTAPAIKMENSYP